MMKTVKHLLCCAIAASALISTGAHAASWKDALSSAASELGNQNNTTQEGGWSLASLTNLLSSGNQALSADNMNNAAGILQYCAKQKLASVTDAENIKNQLKVRPEAVIVDGNRFKPYKDLPYTTIVKGDGKYLSIAAASILAKTYRDDYMDALAEEYPQYDWKGNKGYPTKKHRAAIREFGATPYHRMSYNLLGTGELSLDFKD